MRETLMEGSMRNLLDPTGWSDEDIAALLARVPLDRMEAALQEAAREEAKRRETK